MLSTADNCPAIAGLAKDFAASARVIRTARPLPVWFVFAFVAAVALAKGLAAAATGFTGDEAYTITAARTLALSYFDHPPLHQWILHGFTALFGEGWWARLPFLFMAVAINLPLYGLSWRLFGPEAALWTLFAFNAAPYFMAWPDGLIIPDLRLFLFLATAVWVVSEILFGPRRSKRAQLALWLAAGLAFGCAGLSKYSAIFAPAGLFLFLAGSQRHRSWLWRPEPYLGAALAFAVFSPAIIWNYQNGWVSFGFQASRAGPGLDLSVPAFRAFAEAIGAQIPLLSPWIGAPLLLALAAAMRSRADSAERFSLQLALVPIIFFATMPFFGKHTIPHWFNSGWLFAFPLLGRWLSRKPVGWLRAWAPSAAVLSAALFAAYTAYLIAGPLETAAIGVRLRDPTEWSYNWRGLDKAAAWQGSDLERPSFVAASSWRVGGKAGVALGPAVPVCAFSHDPRQLAFICDPKAWLGKDGLIVIPKEDAGRLLPLLASYFDRLGPSQEVAVGRGERPERIITLTRGYALKQPYPVPYGIGPASP